MQSNDIVDQQTDQPEFREVFPTLIAKKQLNTSVQQLEQMLGFGPN